MGESINKIKEVVYRNLDNFPGILLENDYKTEWVRGGMYTFLPLNGAVLNYGTAVVLYQELEVIRIYEEGKRKVIGKTVYTNFVEGGNLLNLVHEYEQSPEYRAEILRDILYYAMEDKIKGFGSGKGIAGCEFVTNEDNAMLSEEDVLKEIIKRFRESLDGMFVDILVKEEFNKGKYRIAVKGLNVGYQNNNGWGVVLNLDIQHLKTLNKREVMLYYDTSVKEINKAPDMKEITMYLKRELQEFIKKNRVNIHFGVEFRFEGLAVKKETDKYKKIVRKEEDLEKWSQRFITASEGHAELLSTIIDDVKTENGFGYIVTMKQGYKVALSNGGIMLENGQEVYIKGEMNLQEGLRNLIQVFGRNNFTLEVMKTYDYRKRVEGGQ